MTAFHLEKMTQEMTQNHRTVIAVQLFDMLPVGDFLNFAATANFQSLPWCRQKAQRLRAEVRAGMAAIQTYGLFLPPFYCPVQPTAAFDPLLLPSPIRRYQRLWQIEGSSSCICTIKEAGGIGPVEILRYENRQLCWDQWVGEVPLDIFVQDSIEFLDTCCCNVQMACWEAVPAAVLPWPLARLYPRMPRRDHLNVDYAILYFQYQTVGVAMCFWYGSAHEPRSVMPPTSLESDGITSSTARDTAEEAESLDDHGS
jgi:hypothetical protein